MNKVFKVIWNHATQSWVAVSELTSAKGKTKSKKLTALSVAVGSALVGTQALAAVYVNNQEITASGSGSRIFITTGTNKDMPGLLDGSQPQYDYSIRIGDGGRPTTRGGDILIGYGHRNLSSGEGGDTIIGHRANIGGGTLDSFSTGLGYRVQSAGPSVSIGVGARSDIKSYSGWNGTRNGGVAIGAYALQGGNADGGVAVGALSGGDYNFITSIGTLSGVGGFQVDQVRDKGYHINGGNEGATSIGYSAGARGQNSVAVGREATTANFKGKDAVSVGYSTHSIGESSVALGPYAVAGGFSASEITQLQTEKTRLEGVLSCITTAWEGARDELNAATSQTPVPTTVELKFRMGQLLSAREKAQQELNRINADLTRTSATPTQSTVTAMAIGYKANANNQNATAIGRQSQASAISAVALGTNARVNANLATSAVAIGQDANVLQNSTNAIALGTNASVVGDLNGSSNSIAIGNQTAAGNRNARWGANNDRRLGFLAAQNATAVGSESIAGADNALTLGHKNTVNAPNSSAIGSNNTVGTYSNVAYVNNVASATYSGVNSHVLGSNINVTANNTVVIGNNVLVTEANRSGSVVLGDNSSVPTNTTAINSAKVGNITYSGFAGNLGGSSTDGSAEVAADQGRFVSIGNATAPRQIKHVAAGRIEADSTDAINGSQLYSLTGVVSNMGVSVANVIGGNAVLNPNGTVSGFSQPLNTTALGNEEDYTAPTTPAANVSTAITNLNNYVNAGWKIAEGNDTAAKARISPNEQVNFKADGLATVSVKENTTNNGADVTYSVQKGTFDTTTNGTVKANPTEGVVTNTDVATAVNNSGWNTTTTGGTNVTVNPGDQVNYVNGKGTNANVTTAKDANGKDVVSVSYNVNQTTGSLNPNGTVSVADGNSFLNASTVANLVNNASFNVTTAKVDAFAENQEGKADATVKAGGNITYTAGKNIAIKQAGTNFTFATEQNVTFTNANVTSTLALGNGTAGSSSPVVNLKTENATAADVNKEAPTSALNITSADGKPTQIKGVGSSLNTSVVNVTPITDAARTTEKLLDLGNTTNPLSEDVLNSAATVRDLTNLGWVVSASGNDYADSVTNANEVRFNGSNGISVTGETDEHGVRNINVSIAQGKVAGNTTTGVAQGDKNYVKGDQVAKAINESGWKTNVTQTNATTGATETVTKVVTPGTQVNYVDGNSTKANVVVTKAEDGKETVNVSYDLVTEDHLTPVANDAKSVTKPTNIDANKGKDAATVNDVLNAGWNLQANDKAVDAVTHGNNVNFTSKDGSVKITATSNGSTSSLDFAVNATSIVNQVAGTISYNKDGKATTNGDGKRIATVGDVANTINNTGWLTNVTDAKGNVTTKVVTPNTQVNYVNGDGTKANVVANSTTGGLDVTFNVKSANPETLTVDGNGVKVNTGAITEATDVAGDANRGKVTVAAGEGNKVATVQNVANAINSASWTVKVADTQEEITTSTANDVGSSVRAGNEITHVAGKNLKVKRDGRNVAYALANDVSVNTVTAQNSITVGAGNAATTVTTSSAADGVTEVKLADKAGKETRITNVAAGVKDTDAVNVSQLRNSNTQINQNIAHLNNKVNRMGKDLRAGIAGSNAAAGLPQVYIPGKSMVAAAAGTFKGQSAVAVGYSRASDNGKVILKLQGNANTRGDVGGSVGVGYQW